ncbi:MAG: hypothetical protein OXI05_01030 [Bacteroidota bacterium]|nr:hypothetical protein [Bacteroidota bacterium]MXW15573.1 hypothetical protein [Rhodothermaceae bacterium]MXW33032.1 hypothetical protein [Rhodothermaceae bacterium]MYC03504.1 hypothetical protein [Rhodothermaceae bacterium]MYE63924.1 hypothetical protein [Rhodothermaceae bacterium]
MNDHQEQILDRLYGKSQELLCFDETIVFYDLTPPFYHGQENGELLRYGRSKQKRNDCPLVTGSLVLSDAGLPRNVTVLPGNASEPGTLEQTVEKLNGDREKLIMDAGIATKANLEAQGLD